MGMAENRRGDPGDILRVLAVETSTLTGGVALLMGESLVAETTLSVSVQHAERLMPAIDRLLSDSGVSLGEVDLLAVAAGPGSFTGLRVGLAAVQGLAAATGKRAVGVSTLQALALAGSHFKGTVVPLLDARRGQVYAAAFRPGPVPRTLLEDRAVGLPELLSEIARLPGPYLFVGEGAFVYRDSLEKWSGGEKVIASPALGHPRAAYVGLLALRGGGSEVLLPFYGRSPG